MLTHLYRTYFQKSKAFLFPVLGIRKSAYTSPIQTYISWENRVKETDRKLVCLYDITKPGFASFEKELLFQNKLFEDFEQVSDNKSVYLFNFDIYQEDWNHFCRSRYSNLSRPVKQSVRNFFGANSPEYVYMESFMFPEKYFNLYADLLYDKEDYSEGYQLIKSVGELCSSVDMEKETLKIKVNNLENSQTMS